MSEQGCPVNRTIIDLEERIVSDRLTSPKGRRIAEEILDLLKDIARGRAGMDHLPAVASLAEDLCRDTADPPGMEAGTMVRTALADHAEIFSSHVETHNCATGDCVRLAPATLPDGLSVGDRCALLRDTDRHGQI